MSEQSRVSRSKSEAKRVAVEKEAAKSAEKEKSEQELKDELDALLASIDEALGENLECAQEFVNAFQQKGGE